MEPEFAQLSQQIGGRLRAERQRRGWSLNDLSQRTKGQLSKSRISNYEQGIRRMGLEAAQHLASALETVSPAWLLMINDAAPLSEDEQRLIEGFRALPAEKRQRVLEMVCEPESLRAIKPHS